MELKTSDFGSIYIRPIEMLPDNRIRKELLYLGTGFLQAL